MARHRRQIIAYKLYEICFRTKSGLPFVATDYMKLLLESAIARVQRTHKVHLSHMLWMANHPHILAVAKDALEFTKFYGELEKQLTETLKRLLDTRHLSLWDECSVIHIADLNAAKERIVYLYSNPVRADLVDSIDLYPGLSTWSPFKNSTTSLTEVHVKDCPWIRQPMIPRVPARSMSEKQDEFFTERLRKAAKRTHRLVIEPNAWLLPFLDEESASDEDIRGIKAEIIQRISAVEDEERRRRSREGKRVLGANALKRQAIDVPYVPKKFSRSVFVICSEKKLRLQLISAYRHFCDACRVAYHAWKHGDYTVEWPLGSFRPAMPPCVNAVEF